MLQAAAVSASAPEVVALLNLINLLGDPAATKAALAELQAASAKAGEDIASADAVAERARQASAEAIQAAKTIEAARAEVLAKDDALKKREAVLEVRAQELDSLERKIGEQQEKRDDELDAREDSIAATERDVAQARVARELELTAREAAVAEREKDLAIASAQVQALRSELERKLANLKQLVS